MNKCYNALKQLAEIAGEYGDNRYDIVDCDLGFIPFKNGVNKVEEVGNDFGSVARWLIWEGEVNLIKHLENIKHLERQKED